MNQVTFKPFPNKVLVKPINDEQEVNGIIIGLKKQTKHELGEVISVGEDCGSIKISDVIVFSKIHNAKYTEASVDYLIVDYDNILGILEK